MKTLGNLIRRDLRLFFKDKGLFFSSMLTPLILLVLYATFLARVYRDSFLSALPAGLNVSDALIDGTVAAQLASSLLAVSCVTVAFCSNLLMIQDKASGAIRDLTVSPVRRSSISAAYYAASALSTLAVTFTALAACLIYMRVVGDRCSLGHSRHSAADAVRHSTLLLHKLLFVNERSGIGGGNDSFGGLRLSLRRVYADIKLRNRTSAFSLVHARNIRNEPAAQPYARGNFPRNEQHRFSRRGGIGYRCLYRLLSAAI